jgi:tetratricopeptide (TPR) repeat protein
VISLLARKLDCSATYLTSGLPEDAIDELRTTLDYARIALENGEASVARDHYANAISFESLSAVPAMQSEALWGYARALEAAGSLHDAVVALKAIAEESSPDWDAQRFAEVQMGLCRCYQQLGDLKTSIEVGEDALRRIEATGRPWTDESVMLGVTLLAAHYRRDDLLYASHLARQLTERAEYLGSPRALMAVYWNSAWIAEALGDPRRALALSERAIALLGEADDPRNLARLRMACGHFLLKARPDRAGEARDLLVLGAKQAKEVSVSTVDVAWGMTYQAQAELVLGNPVAAAELAENAIKMLGEAGGLSAADTHVAAADAYEQLGRLDDAINELVTASAYLETTGASRAAAQTWSDIAFLLGRTEQIDAEVSALRQALDCLSL